MEFLIFSDSHGRQSAIDAVWSRQVRRPDAVFFLGDGLRDVDASDVYPTPLYAVAGNCDWSAKLRDGTAVPAMQTLSFDGHKLLLTHGHLYQVKSGCGALLAEAARMGADIVLFGHTHTPVCERVAAGETVGGVRLEKDLYLFNPGSLGAGSFGTLCLRSSTVLFSHGKL